MRLHLLSVTALVACGPPAGFKTNNCRGVDGTCVEISAEVGADVVLETMNELEDDTTVILGSGTFSFENAITIRNANHVQLMGQGMDETLLDFSGVTVQANGVDVVGDHFLIQDLTIQDAVKDGLRIEDSSDIVIRRVRATWSAGPVPENGGYGLYPVKVRRVLLEESEAFHASDAGIYVGQCIDAIVRNNVAKANVAGLEIENTQFADVYGNLVEDNTGGLVVFDLPGNPVIGRDVYIHDNIVRNNNRANFAPGGVVSQIPAGTGTFALASRRVEITNNTYANNNTVDIAVVSGLAIQSDASRWFLEADEIIGDIDDLQLDEGPGGVIANFRSSDIYIHGNEHSGSGTRPDNTSLSDRPLGFLIAVTYGGTPVDTVIYDTIGESSFSNTEASENSNDNHICVGADDGVTFASLNLPGLAQATVPNKSMTYRPDPPFVPFNCTDLRDGAIQLPDLGD